MEAQAAEPRSVPSALDRHSNLAGLRAIASFEAFKGVLVIVLGTFLLVYHTHAEDLAENLLDHLHVETDARLGHAVIDAAYRLNNAHLLTIGSIAFTYAAVRFVEAWGLWHQRVWAEWFTLLSGATYLPFELAKVVEKPTWLRISIFAINLIIVLYMLYIRIRERHFTNLA